MRRVPWKKVIAGKAYPPFVTFARVFQTTNPVNAPENSGKLLM
jgi:hypothetical protein